MKARYVALALLTAGALFVLAGPALAPHGADVTVGPAYSPPGESGLLGTDHLGRDVTSRMLHGGSSTIATSVIAALGGSIAGAAIGLTAALSLTGRRWLESLLMRPVDAVAAVPPIVLMLLVLTAMPDRAGLILAVVIVTAPLSARVIRAAAVQAAGRTHVESAVARGEKWCWLAGREVLPLIAGTVAADLGIRFVAAIYVVTAAGFLGVTAGPDNWGRLIADTLPGAALQPWALIAPVSAIAVITVAVNLIADRVLHDARGVLA